MKIVIGSDHGGYDLKQMILDHLKQSNQDVIDIGCFSKEAVDYPDIAFKVAQKVGLKEADLGIMIDGAGVGSAMAANKMVDVRAAVCNDLFSARNAKEHNDANLLTLGSMVVGPGTAKWIVDTFINTQFQGGRHEKRVQKIKDIERSNFKGLSIHPSASSTPEPIPLREIIQNVVESFLTSPKRNQSEFSQKYPAKSEQAIRLITEDFLREQHRHGIREIRVVKKALITPLAKDYARDHNIIFVIE